MELRNTKNLEDKRYERQFYKPHFGPEETQQVIQTMRQVE